MDVDPESLLCADVTRTQMLSPIGTAGCYDIVALVEAPGPWPSDVADIDGFADAMAAAANTRVLAVPPGAGASDSRLVTIWRRCSWTSMVGTDHVIGADECAAALPELVSTGSSSHVVTSRPAPPDVVICGHGKRDRCCGSRGVRLETQVAHRWPGVRVRRCSHLGGHRFAPTAMTMIDGRSWAFLDPTLLDAVVGGSLDEATLRRVYRGSCSLDRWAQVVEAELLATRPETVVGQDLESVMSVPDGDGGATVSLGVSGPAGRFAMHATVSVGRVLAVPACGSAPEEASKSASEFTISDLQVTRIG